MEVLATVQQRCAEVEAGRRPLVRRPSVAAAPRMYNPRFEEDYAAGKDYDPDRSLSLTLTVLPTLTQSLNSAPRMNPLSEHQLGSPLVNRRS